MQVEALERDADHERQLRSVSVRTEPLGMDRHQRRYWWLTGGRQLAAAHSHAVCVLCVCCGRHADMQGL